MHLQESIPDAGDTAAAARLGAARKIAGSETASAGAQGIDPNSGSAGDVRGDTNTLGQLDALTIKNNAWKTAWGYKVQAANQNSQAQFDQITAQNEANSTILTGGLNAASSIAMGYGYAKYGGKGGWAGGWAGGSPNFGNTA